MSEFDKFADNYREIHSQKLRHSGANSEFFCEYKIREVVAGESGHPASILDLGCGDGLSIYFFGRVFPKTELHGIDVSEKSVRIAAGRGITNAAFQVYNGQTIPFDKERFDLVFVSQVFHHIPHELHAGLLEEIFRVLSPAGRLYLFEHNPLNPLTRYIVSTCVFDKDARVIRAGRLIAACRRAGFQSISRRYTLFFPRHRFFTPLLQIESGLGWLPLGFQYYIHAKKPDHEYHSK
jgi:ubiquinone/menaquinone biosynthesis C-methylase UbiE